MNVYYQRRQIIGKKRDEGEVQAFGKQSEHVVNKGKPSQAFSKQKQRRMTQPLHSHQKAHKTWGNIHCFQNRLNCSEIRFFFFFKKKIKKFLHKGQAQGSAAASSPATAAEASLTLVCSAMGSSGAEDWVTSSAVISQPITSRSKLCKSTPVGCLTR